MSDITIRPARPGEVSALAALVTCSERASGGVRVLTADELADEGDGTTTTIEFDTRVVEIDGQLAGVAWVLHRRSDERLDRAYVFGEVAVTVARVTASASQLFAPGISGRRDGPSDECRTPQCRHRR